MAQAQWAGVDTSLSGKSPTAIVLGTSAIRAAAATTTSYVASNYVATGQAKRITLEFTLVWVDSTSTEWYIEWSHDGSTWFRSVDYAVGGGTNTGTVNVNTLASSASLKWVDSFEPEGIYMRVNVKKTGGVGADTLAVTAVLLGE